MNLHFYYCDICGKVLTVLSPTPVPTYCCGRPMQELPWNTVDGAAEKHVPLFHIRGNTVHVTVGSLPHPMQEEHSIHWIGIRTEQGFQFKKLNPQDSPEAYFSISPGDKANAAYAYCNIHGLWYSEEEEYI